MRDISYADDSNNGADDINFESCIAEQVRLHPSVTPQDIVKLCYQSAFGAEHLLSDIEAARKYLDEEFDLAGERSNESNRSNGSENNQSGEKLYERISRDVCRVNISAWKDRSISKELLFEMFVQTASKSENSEKSTDGADGANEADKTDETEIFMQNIAAVKTLAENKKLPFSVDEWNIFYSEYEKGGIRPVRHSEVYRINEQPSYRVVSARFIPALSTLSKHGKST